MSSTDGVLLAAWERLKEAGRELQATGVDATEQQDAAANAKWNDADDIVSIAQPATISGAAVKLRRALLMDEPNLRVTHALINDDDAMLLDASEQFGGVGRLIMQALEALERLQQPRGPQDPDAALQQAWQEFSSVKLRDTEAVVTPRDRMNEVDRILFGRDAETVAGVALKLRAALFAIADERVIEVQALSLPATQLGERLRLSGAAEQVMWSAIKTIERHGGVA